jgi:peptidoglycan/LPS O-acetylase OafA/YrhL
VTVNASSEHSGQRRDIQFLRAIAVLSVVAFHFWPSRLVSGFLGVDVFFVISGFLITSLIVREITSTKSFSITAFWVRRIRRIFPAAITVIAATIVAVFVTHISDQAYNIVRHGFASAFSAENLLLGLDAVDYVHRTDSTSPLQHYWSLSVEEQFYIVWPIVVLIALLLTKKSQLSITRFLGIALSAIGIASFVYAVIVAQGNPSSYFDPLARAWELALGAGVAVWLAHGGVIRRGRAVVNRAAWLLLVASFAIPHLESFAPGAGILPAAIAAATVLATGPVPSTRTLPWSTVALSAWEWIGDRSYSIYLWHWPILLLAPVFLGHSLGTITRIGAIALTFILAEFSYRFVENPLRRARAPWSRNPIVMGGIALVTSAAVVGASFVFFPNFGKRELNVDLAAQMSSTPLNPSTKGYNADFPYTIPYCDGAGATVFDCATNSALEFDPLTYPIAPPRSATCQYANETRIDDCVLGDVTATRSIALVGDSHARAMWSSLDVIGHRAGYAVHEFLAPSCPYSLSHLAWCKQRSLDLAPELNSGKYDLIVFAQRADVINPEAPPTSNAYEALYTELLTNRVPFVVIRDNPKQGSAMSNCVLKNANEGTCSRHDTPFVDHATQTAWDLGVPVIDLSAVYCPNHVCRAVQGGMQVWRDNGHILTFYHRSAAPLLWSKLMQLGLIQPK